MPYSNPTSPLASPSKEVNFSKKGWSSHHVEDVMYTTSPMQGIPRRASTSGASGASTPRRSFSPPMSRQPSTSQPFATSRPMEGLPRRRSSGLPSQQAPQVPQPQQQQQQQEHDKPAFGSSSLPTSNGEGSLGLKLHPSPVKATTTRPKSLTDSASSVESPLPQTPDDPASSHSPVIVKSGQNSNNIPFPDFEPPPLQSHSAPHRTMARAAANLRPAPIARRGSDRGHRSTASMSSPPSYMTTSASTSQLETEPFLSPTSRPTTGMIRKKSGEIVKPSIKYHRSMSTPNLRDQDDDEPESPHDLDSPRRQYLDETPKSVRFADADGNKTGTHLESIILFLRQQKPAAVGHAVDPDNNAPVTDTETELDSAAENSDFVSFRTRRNASARAADEDKVVMHAINRIPRVRTDFSPDSQGCRNGENVLLEKTELVTNDGVLSFKGTCIVRNLAFSKIVTVRFTVDHWQTRSEVTGHHICHIPSHVTLDEGWDRFGFTIKLEDVKRNLSERQLIVCIRYSCNGQDFWDSNQGTNYNFTFTRTARRKQMSGPASLGGGGGFMRLNEDSASHLQDLRHRVTSRNFATQDDIDTRSSGRRGRTATTTKREGLSGYSFPSLARVRSHDVPSRTDSPVQRERPPTAYKVPSPPDVHTHLSLSKYCAPSPSSPPTANSAPLVHAPGNQVSPPILAPAAKSSEELPSPVMNLHGGQYATPSSPKAPQPVNLPVMSSDKVHDVFSPSSDDESEPEGLSTPRLLPSDGDLTPVVARARSPVSGNGNKSDSSPEAKPLTLNKSTGDLQAMLEASKASPASLPTPPSSNLSSPPSSPNVPMPSHMLMSPGSSSASTGESSPIDTASTNNSLTDLANLMLDMNVQERARQTAADTKTFNQSSYQEFLDKFCFFTSPRMTPANEDPVYTRNKTVSLPSGTSSPGGFPFFASTGGSSLDSPRTTPTGTHDGLGNTRFSPSPVKGSTPRASPGQASPSFNVMDPHHWANATHRRGNSASLAAQ